MVVGRMADCYSSKEFENMLAIPPNRQFASCKARTACLSYAFICGIRFAAVIVALVGVAQPSWSQSDATGSHAGPIRKGVEQTSANGPAPQSAIRFVTVPAQPIPIPIKATAAMAPIAPIAKPALAPPLA